MRKLAYQIKQICSHTKSGSHSSQASRRRRCSAIARDLEACGFRNLDIQNLKPKHIEALVAHWKERQLAIGTIKNLMVELRRVAEYIGKENIVKRTNREYGIDNRTYVTNVSKANMVTDEQLSRVTDPYTKASLRLEREFGLRREESIKIQPAWADLGDRLRLKDSWTKGGKYRELPIVSGVQRKALDDAKALAGKGSLIPEGMRYKDQLEGFKSQCDRAGIMHEMEHAWGGGVFFWFVLRGADQGSVSLESHLLPSCPCHGIVVETAWRAVSRPHSASHPRRAIV